MRIPIKALKEFAQKYDLSHVIIFAYNRDDGTEGVATYGRTILQSSEAAEFGNCLKDVLGWPGGLHGQPSRVPRLQKQIKELEKRLRQAAI